jgi:hypothetical protein
MPSRKSIRRERRWFRPLRLEPLEPLVLPGFVAPLAFDAGGSPLSVAVGDFNLDGTPDLAVANNTTGGTVSVLLGNGDGSFQAPRSFAVGRSPRSVAVGDFNGDGTPDLAVANQGDRTVSVLLGNGDGSFQTARTFDAIGANFLVVADINGDGAADIVTPVSVLLGNGDGTFQAARSLDSGSLQSSVAAGDFNGDGAADLAVTNDGSRGNVSVLLGNGDGSFQAPVNYSGNGSLFVTTADVNGDGSLDLINTAGVLLGNGDGSFKPLRTFSAGINPSSVAVGDFNGDGTLDLAAANYLASGSVSVLLGNGDGSFQRAQSFAAGTQSVFVAVGDFNGDSTADLAVANNITSGTATVLLGNGDGSFQAARSVAAGSTPFPVVVGDFNGDDIADLAMANAGSGTVSVLLGNGDGSFQAARNYYLGDTPDSVAVGDFNGDGILDLAVANAGSYPDYNGTVCVLLGNGDGSFQAAPDYNTGNTSDSVAVGDFNGDGTLDLAVANAGSSPNYNGTVSVLLGNGNGTFQAARTFVAGINSVSVVVGDFTGDGTSDLAIANTGTYPNYRDSSVSLLLGNGDGTFQAAVNYTTGSPLDSVAAGDFTGDGTLDLAVANDTVSGTVSVLLGNGDGTFQAARTFSAGSYPQSVSAGDFNGDGTPDLAVADNGSFTVRVLLGNGDGSFQTTNFSYVVGAYPRSVAVGDFNGDGAADLAVANSNDVSILLNDDAWGGPRPGGQPPSDGRATVTAAEPTAAPALPSDLVTADFLARPGALPPTPWETTTQRLVPVEPVPSPLEATPAAHAADWMFAAPAGVGETASGLGWMPAADLDRAAWTRWEPSLGS